MRINKRKTKQTNKPQNKTKHINNKKRLKHHAHEKHA